MAITRKKSMSYPCSLNQPVTCQSQKALILNKKYQLRFPWWVWLSVTSDGVTPPTERSFVQGKQNKQTKQNHKKAFEALIAQSHLFIAQLKRCL